MLPMNRHGYETKLTLGVATLSTLGFVTAGLAWAFSLLIFVGALLTVQEAVRILKRPDELTAFRALAVALFAGYFLGPSLSITLWHLGAAVDPVVLAGPFAYHGYNPSLSSAIALAYAAIALLLLADRVTSRFAPLRLVQPGLATKDAIFLLTLAVLVMVALATGDLGYMGTRMRGDDTVSLLGSLGGTVLPALVPVLLMAALAKSVVKPWRALYLALLVSMCAVLVIQGRRVLILAVFTALALARLYGPYVRMRVTTAARRSRRRPALLLGAAGVFVLSGLYYFSAFRLATDQRGQNAALNVRTAVAMQMLRQNRHQFLKFASAQAGARSGTLPGYLGSLLESHHGGRLMGECILANMITAVPRALLADKSYWTSRYSCTDEHVNAAYALPQTDSPATLLTQGYADFGWLGALTYPLLVGAIMQLGLGLARLPGILSLKAFIISSVVFASLFVEQSLSFYLVAIRNLGIVVAFGSLVWLGGAVRTGSETPQI